jgi:pantothenate kinase
LHQKYEQVHTLYPLDLDAFHFKNDELIARNLLQVKGRYDTYDVVLLREKLDAFLNGEQVQLPRYSRNTHERMDDGIRVDAVRAILFLVGLWIQRDDGVWDSIRERVHYTFTVNGPLEKLKNNTIQRHVRGGRDTKQAEEFYQSSDVLNTHAVLTNKVPADEELLYFEDI